MKLLNVGSLNVDYVYSVSHIVTPGETLEASRRSIFSGGKGLNQSIALAKAGLSVWHAGLIGAGGELLTRTLHENGVDVSLVGMTEQPVGHTIIQVDENGQNSILLFGGGNRCLTPAFVEETLTGFGADDVLVLQNEVNCLPQLIDAAAARGLRIALNPSPFDSAVAACDLSKVSVFFVNEIEGAQMAGTAEPEGILAWFAAQLPRAVVVLTLGADGALCLQNGTVARQGVFPVRAVDTTAAGDTFSGFFLASWLGDGNVQRALRLAACAASLAVSRKGAADSIPTMAEVQARLAQR